MKKISLAMTGIAALVASMASTTSQAAMRLWTINNAKFNDGGSWTGSFEYDAATNTFGNYSWTTSGGDEITFPGTTYTNANAVDPAFYQSFAYGNDQIYLYAFSAPTDYPGAAFRSLYLTTRAALPDAGGTMQLDFTSGYAAGECHNCNPYRPLVSGFLTSGTGGVPEPASWAMMIGGIGMAGLGGRYARRKTRVAFA